MKFQGYTIVNQETETFIDKTIDLVELKSLMSQWAVFGFEIKVTLPKGVFKSKTVSSNLLKSDKAIFIVTGGKNEKRAA